MPKTSIQINSVIVCEDIRQEKSGKAIFIGVFPGDITAMGSPAHLKFSFWFTCYTKEHENAFEVKISLLKKSDNSSEELYKNVLENSMDAKKSIDDAIEVNVALIGLPVLVEEESILIVSTRPIKGKWKELSKRHITIANNPIATM